MAILLSAFGFMVALATAGNMVIPLRWRLS
jgi:hypothetical protein